jgi:hypothetical protein
MVRFSLLLVSVPKSGSRNPWILNRNLGVEKMRQYGTASYTSKNSTKFASALCILLDKSHKLTWLRGYLIKFSLKWLFWISNDFIYDMMQFAEYFKYDLIQYFVHSFSIIIFLYEVNTNWKKPQRKSF